MWIAVFLIFLFSIICFVLAIKSGKRTDNTTDAMTNYIPEKLHVSRSNTRVPHTNDVHEPQLHRHGNHSNNMNCDWYKFSGKYTTTGRIRTNKDAYVFKNEDPLEVIKNMGYDEPIE